jgi:uncharacterized protein DUF4157
MTRSPVRVTQPSDSAERDVDSIVPRLRSPHATAPPSVWTALESAGRPLIESERAAAPGLDVSTIRLHSGGPAAASARELRANAYAFGDHIVVGEGYEPGSVSSQRLIAHELVHVAHQHGTSEPVVHRQGEEEQPSSARFADSHLLGTFVYRLDPTVLPPASTGQADPQEVGATPYGSSLVSTSAINPAGTWTLSLGGTGVASRSSLLSQPVVGGPTVTASPTDYLQVQASMPGIVGPEGLSPGTQRAANLQAQVSPPHPFRVNPSLVAGLGYASNQHAFAPDTLVPSAFATLIAESLIGGPDAAHARFSAAANVSLIRTPYLNGILSDVSGVSVGGALTLFSGYYNDAPATDPTDRRPVGITQTPRLTLGIAGSYAEYRGRSLADPTRAGLLRTAGVDVFATYVSPLTRVAGSSGRFFVTVTPGLRAAAGEGQGGVGASGMVTIGWLPGASPAPHGGNVEHE